MNNFSIVFKVLLIMLLALAFPVGAVADKAPAQAAPVQSYDQQARNELSQNDIKAFVYAWFAKFDHQAPLEQIVSHLGDELDMAFPGFPILSKADFQRWYQGVIDNIQWNSHEISNLEVSGNQNDGWKVSLDVRWQARTYDGQQYDQLIHQDWQLVAGGDGVIRFKRHRATGL